MDPTVGALDLLDGEISKCLAGYFDECIDHGVSVVVTLRVATCLGDVDAHSAPNEINEVVRACWRICCIADG